MNKRDVNERFLEEFQDLFQELSEEYDLPVENIEEVIIHYFQNIRKGITDWRMPIIKIPNFGTFRPREGKLSFYIKKNIGYVRRGYVTKPAFWERIKSIWYVRKRLMREDRQTNATPKSELDWRTWRDYGDTFDIKFFRKEKHTSEEN